MSDLRPIGTTVTFGGEEHSFLFTLNVIDAVQSKYSCSVSEILLKMSDYLEEARIIRFLLMELLNDEMKRLEKEKIYTEREVGRLITVNEIPEIKKMIVRCYGLSIPEEGGDGSGEEAELLDIASLILIAATKMGYTENEVFQMTPKKFFLLFDKFLELSGKKKKEYGIDDLP